jgi:ATP-dependent DNA helicase RecQ
MEKHLKNQYGHNSFRDCQKDVIQDIIDGKDTMVVLPTGGGKSICYQFPATFLKKKSVVVSPLISLMTDQSMHLTAKGIKSICLNGETSIMRSLFSKKPNKDIVDATIIYCTPEYLTCNINIFKQIEKDICLFAIDEAHSISEWGHSFRKSYSSLGIIKKEFKNIPISALTATATPQVLDDIFKSLRLKDTNQYQLSTVRDNLHIHVREKSGNILADLNIDPTVSTIIYTQTRKNTEMIYNLLKSASIPVGYYHAGLSSEVKHQTHQDFVNDKIKVIVATICFGMGIDKPDIRKVINYGSPCNLETYYQEIGRAGRDGMMSEVVLFYSEKDYVTNCFLISQDDQNNRKRKLLNVFQKYISNTTDCRQLLIEQYFDSGNLTGPSITDEPKCGICDNCTTEVKVVKKENLIKEATLITNLIKSFRVNYGIVKLINILRGSCKKFRQNTYYGKGSGYTVVWWKKFINILVNQDYLDKKPYSFYTVIAIGLNNLPKKLKLHIQGGSSKKSADTSIRNSYKNIRSKAAIQAGVSPYMIINDKVIENICKARPTTLVELVNIDGITIDFVKKYGTLFLGIKEGKEDGKVVEKKVVKKSSTKDESYSMYMSGKTIDEISEIRGIKKITIESHISCKFKENPGQINLPRESITKNIEKQVSQAVFQVGKDRLKPIKNYLESKNYPNISYFQIKICLLLI